MSTSNLAKRYLPQLKSVRGEYCNSLYTRIANEVSLKFDKTYFDEEDEYMVEEDETEVYETEDETEDDDEYMEEEEH